jgi:GT2 family glycosyltransferase
MTAAAPDSSIDVLMAVHDGAAWIGDVLDSLNAQTAPYRLTVWDNASTDDTVAIITRVAPDARVVRSEDNIGFWAAIEVLSESCSAEQFLALTDVQLAPDYLEHAAAAFAAPEVGAVEGKLLQLDEGTRSLVIDTVGFSIDRSRRVTISGHGQRDLGQYAAAPIFGVEGAAPMFRTQAFRDAAVDGHVIDPAFRTGALGYGDDLDLAWRLSLFGWQQVLEPAAIGWHDRSTTRTTATGLLSHLGRVRQRREIPLEKRILDWVNVRASRLKNDRTRDVLRDLPFIAARELMVLAYTLLVEPRVLAGVPRLVRLAPAMLRQRRIVQARAQADLRHWFT